MSWSRCWVIRSDPGSSVCQHAPSNGTDALEPDRGLVEELRARGCAKREPFEIVEQPLRRPCASLCARAAPLPGSTASCQAYPPRIRDGELGRRVRVSASSKPPRSRAMPAQARSIQPPASHRPCAQRRPRTAMTAGGSSMTRSSRSRRATTSRSSRAHASSRGSWWARCSPTTVSPASSLIAAERCSEARSWTSGR